MKKLFLSFFALFLSLGLSASHFIGGEITWKCLPNGSYIFSMVVYRDCTGIPIQYQNETIEIVGTPLPTNGITSIIVKPDSNRWMNANFGETSPDCTNNYGSPYSCSNGDNGTVQAFYYNSDPITLMGVPPTSGWNFYWEAPCCRPNLIENVNTSGQMLMKATMFPSSTGALVNNCFDSSPEFIDFPQVMLCRSSLQKYKHGVVDVDCDSISYSWGTPINTPIASPVSLTYKPGYSQGSPMPNRTIDPLNIPATLNSTSGDISFLVNNNSGRNKYIQVVDVSSWRDGVEVSRITREVVFSILDCPVLPSGDTNLAPTFASNFTQDIDGVYRDTVTAGTLIDQPIQASDYDSTGAGINLHVLKLIPFGQSFSADFSMSGPCDSAKTCAYLDPPPVLNMSGNPANYEFSAFAVVGSRFKWQTNCSSLTDSLTSKTHYFSFKYFDDHCPLPQIAYQTLAITVLPSTQPCSLLTSIQNEKTFSESLHLYPNPTSGLFSIDLGQFQEQVELKILNVKGQLIQQETFLNRDRISVEIQAKGGIYFLQVINSKGEQVNLKVIKQ